MELHHISLNVHSTNTPLEMHQVPEDAQLLGADVEFGMIKVGYLGTFGRAPKMLQFGVFTEQAWLDENLNWQFIATLFHPNVSRVVHVFARVA